MPRGYPTPPEALAEARRLYETTSLDEVRIAALSGVGRATFRRVAKADSWTRPDGARREPPRQDVVAALRQRIESEIVAAEAAMDRTAERGVDAVERISRSLASLVRTLRELGKYDEEQAARAGRPHGAHEGADDDIADLDAFRDALAERLAKLQLDRGA